MKTQDFKEKSQHLYADANATTSLSERVQKRLQSHLNHLGNPSSQHVFGRNAKALLEEARENVGHAVGCRASQVVFTSGASEANTMALLGSFYAHKVKQPKAQFRLVVSEAEHASTRETAEFLSSEGARVEWVSLEPSGQINLEHLRQLMKEKAHCVSVMAVQNETGVLFPVKEISELCLLSQTPFHCDAVQAWGKQQASYWNCADLISLSAHKIHGPPGAGALIVKGSGQLHKTHFGGGQEAARRGGTENLLGIVGMGEAAKGMSDPVSSLVPASAHRPEFPSSHSWELAWAAFSPVFESSLRSLLPNCQIVGETCPRIPNTSCIRIPGIAAQTMLIHLDSRGIAVSAGSACSSGAPRPSATLLAMGLSPQAALECFRVSFLASATEDEQKRVADAIASSVRFVFRKNASSRQNEALT